MTSLSEGYVRTLDLLDKGDIAEATRQFRKGVVAPVKKLYSEAAETYPVRFSKVSDWCAWTKRLYILARRTEDTLVAGDVTAARQLIPDLRRHFYDLHREAGLQRSNDYLYALLMLLQEDAPSADELKAAQDLLQQAEPSMKAKAETGAYRDAKDAWLEQLGPALEDGQLAPDEREQLRDATLVFYNAFGVQFE